MTLLTCHTFLVLYIAYFLYNYTLTAVLWELMEHFLATLVNVASVDEEASSSGLITALEDFLLEKARHNELTYNLTLTIVGGKGEVRTTI